LLARGRTIAQLTCLAKVLQIPPSRDRYFPKPVQRQQTLGCADKLGIDPKDQVFMLKRSKFETTQTQIMHRAEELIGAASNRYRITVQVANRAKRRRYEDFDNIDDPMMKPVIRAIIEMSDELTQPEIIGE
jgi:DNA-directed RNA polymerase subunit omega